MKIGIFTDSHYSTFDIPGSLRRRTEAPVRIKAAYEAFTAAGCELAVCLGDLTDGDVSREAEQDNLRDLASVMDRYSVPTYCVMGNHDAFDFTQDEFYSLIGEEKQPKNLDIGGRYMIFLDACWFISGEHYMPGDSDWTDTYYPFADDVPALLDGCREAYVFMHQNIDPDLPENHCLFNADEMRSIFENDGRVKKVFQGHYHPGHTSVHNGIGYITLPALCEHENSYMITDI